jgi:hypothetical protein
MGEAMRPRSVFDRPSTLPIAEVRPQMAAEYVAALQRRTEPRPLALQAASVGRTPDVFTRREVTEILDSFGRTMGQDAAVKEEDRDMSAFVALGVVVGIVALALSS